MNIGHSDWKTLVDRKKMGKKIIPWGYVKQSKETKDDEKRRKKDRPSMKQDKHTDGEWDRDIAFVICVMKSPPTQSGLIAPAIII